MSDLIKREDAIEALTAEFCITGRENARTILNYLDLVKTRIEAIPSADLNAEFAEEWAKLWLKGQHDALQTDCGGGEPNE